MTPDPQPAFSPVPGLLVFLGQEIFSTVDEKKIKKKKIEKQLNCAESHSSLEPKCRYSAALRSPNPVMLHVQMLGQKVSTHMYLVCVRTWQHRVHAHTCTHTHAWIHQGRHQGEQMCHLSRIRLGRDAHWYTDSSKPLGTWLPPWE